MEKYCFFHRDGKKQYFSIFDIIVAQWHCISTSNTDNINSGNGLLPFYADPYKPALTYHQLKSYEDIFM